MSEDNPFIGLKFNDAPYKAALDKVNSSYDASISEAATEAGMAAGMGGGNVATVGADAYVKATSARNNAEAGLLNAKAGAESNFNAERDFNAAKWKADQAGPLDWITTGLGVAGTVASTIMTGGATLPALIAGGGSLLGNLPKNNTMTQSQIQQKVEESTSPYIAPKDENEIKNIPNPVINRPGGQGYRMKKTTNDLGWLKAGRAIV